MSITRDDIIALSSEAGQAGDLKQVEICNRALNVNGPKLTGDEIEAAWDECVRVITEARNSIASDKAPHIAASDRSLIDDARAIAAAMTFDAQRAYLAAKGSDYAESPDLMLIAAAVLGRAQHDLRELAARLEYEIGHVSDLNRKLTHEIELRAIREGSPAVQNGPYAYMTGPHADA